jgi:hypothetical protein
MYGTGVSQLHESASCMKKPFTETQYKINTTRFSFSSCVGVSLDIVDCQLKDFVYIAMQSQIQPASTVMTPL